MYTRQPEGCKYDCLVIPQGESPYFEEISDNPYKTKKTKKKEYTTFIVFSSSEIILSGRYEQEMKSDYEFFVSEVIGNKNVIEEKIKEPDTDLLTFLKKTKSAK